MTLKAGEVSGRTLNPRGLRVAVALGVALGTFRIVTGTPLPYYIIAGYVAALGLGLASTIPGRSPLIDGFGLIAFASLFPMITVMAYAQIGQWRSRHQRSKEEGS